MLRIIMMYPTYIRLCKTTLLGFLSFMTPFLDASNPTDTKTMRVFMSSSATYLRAPDWLILTRLPRGSSSGLKFIYRPETLSCFPKSSLDYCD